MKVLAVIPARGGSKRLPHKNIINFLGKPIIAHTIEAAARADVFEKIIVSSEDQRILEIAGRYPVELHPRPSELATDSARVTEVCEDVIRTEAEKGNHYDILCCLYATAPLRNAEDIKKTVELVSQGNCDCAMAMTAYYYPPHQALVINPSGLLVPAWPKMVNKQSQDVPQMFIDNGSTYVVSMSEFRKSQSFRGSRIMGHFMPRHRSVDIDTQEDFELALLYASGGKQ